MLSAHLEKQGMSSNLTNPIMFEDTEILLLGPSHCRVQNSLFEELLDGGITHVWFAFAGQN